MPKLLSLLTVVACIAPVWSAPKFELVGVFSDMVYTEEHQGGHEVYLWLEDGKAFGHLEFSPGNALGEYSTSTLDDLKFDRTTGKLSFAAKNPAFQYDKNGQPVVVHNMFYFDGSLQGAELKGQFICRNLETKAPCLNDETVVMKKSGANMKGSRYDIKSKKEWGKVIGPIIQNMPW